MQTVNLAIVQTVEEISIISKSNIKQLKWIPLNLDCLIHLYKNNFQFIDLNKYLDNKLHKEGINYSTKLIKSLKYSRNLYEWEITRYKGIIRKYFNSIFFIDYIVKKLKKKFLISKIIVSGLNKYDFKKASNNLFVSAICKELFKDKCLQINEEKNDQKDINYSFKLKKNIRIKNYILLSNLGYNFSRIIRLSFKKKIKILVFQDNQKINFFKKFVLKLMGVHIAELKKTKNILNKTKLHFPKIIFHYKNKNYSKLLNARTNQIKKEILYLKNIYKIFKKILENNKPKIIILNMVRGINGYFSAFGKKFKIPCFYISHGTLSKTNNFYSDAYNKILSEELISSKDNIFCLQSKISKKFADTFRINEKNLATGNLIFSDTRKKKQKYLLYVVTNRNFSNMQFYGVETFYEYFDNLIEFDKIAKNYNLTVIIKLHPSISHLQDKLEAIFKNMSFSNRNLEDLLTNAIATISFSSSAIEDSLCSHIPVILLDNWNRYKHCSSEVNPKAKNKCVYYVKNFGSLLKAYNSILHSSDISFDKFVFKGRSEKNLKDKIFLRYLN